MPHLLVAVWVVLVGLVVGSYLNVVIHRLPRGVSTILPRSRCPSCGAAIRFRDNLPVASFLLLSGRCRECGAAISARYPLVEAATAALFLACYERFGATPAAAVAAIFCCLVIALAGIDLEHLLLPDTLTLPGVAAGLALQPWWPGVEILEAVAGTLVGAGLMFLLGETWAWLRNEEALGLGDAKMLAMVGAFLGWQGVVVTLFCGVFAGAATGIALLVLRRGGLKAKLPFGAFLGLGALVALFFGPGLLSRYLVLL